MEVPAESSVKICLNMASMRWKNWPALRMNYERAFTPGVELTWQIVVYKTELAAVGEHELSSVRQPWINILAVDSGNYSQAVVDKTNQGLDHLRGTGFVGYTVSASDDNLMPRSWLRRIKEGDGHPVIVCSHKRGSGRGASGHGTSDLIATPTSMRIGRVNGEQVYVHSDVLRFRHYAEGNAGDGVMVETLFKERRKNFYYIPDLFLPFNALEEGRWEAEALREVLDA